jgi:drug/metabolite transporter (DMT)-like permease
LLVLRGLAGFFGLYGAYVSVQYLSLSDATVLTFITPILTGFSGAVFLREPLSLKETLAALCSFLGVVFISRPQFLFDSPQGFLDPSEVMPAQRMLSVIAALIGVLGVIVSFLTLRAIGERAHILHPVASFSSQCVLVSTLCIIIFKVPLVIPTRTLGLAMLLLNTIFGIFAQVLLTIGLQYETAGRGALAIYTSIIFALVFEFTIFQTTPSAHSIIGSLMIVSSAIYTTLTKKTVIKPATDSSSKRSLLHSASASDHDGYQEA